MFCKSFSQKWLAHKRDNEILKARKKRKKERKTEGKKERRKEGKNERTKEGKKDRKTERQKDRKKERQTHTHTHSQSKLVTRHTTTRRKVIRRTPHARKHASKQAKQVVAPRKTTESMEQAANWGEQGLVSAGAAAEQAARHADRAFRLPMAEPGGRGERSEQVGREGCHLITFFHPCV